MTQQIKEEALEQLVLDIKFGFENEAALFDSIRDMFYDEPDFDEVWLRQVISQKYQQRQQESLTWKRPTDFDKLAQSFDQLIMQGIVCLHNAGYTKQDGEGDCMETIEKLNELGIKATGYCYYHSQDLGRAVDEEIRNLYLGFDSPAQNDQEALQVAGKIVSALRENNFDVHWSGTVDQRIEIRNINWQKVPDNGNWGPERVINILTKSAVVKKPFWKFW